MNIITNKTELITILKNQNLITTSGSNTSKSNDNFLIFMKYIKLSKDQKCISLFENNKLNIYDLDSLLIDHNLKYMFTIGIILSSEKNISKNIINEIKYEYVYINII